MISFKQIRLPSAVAPSWRILMISRCAIVTCLLALGACTQNTSVPQAAVAPPQQAAELQAPIALGQGNARARTCEALTRVGRHRSGAGAALSMAVSNDGGWCARGLSHRGYAFSGGNVIETPKHGEARVRHLASRSVLEYRASPGYVGDDSFSVTLTPGNSVYLVSVTVQR